MSREIYLDNGATTRPFDEVLTIINDTNKEVYGNPSSLHRKGIEAERLISHTKKIIAEPLGVNAKEILFTSGGTESNNLAIAGYLQSNPRKGKHIITTAIEHPSVLQVFNALLARGYTMDVLRVDSAGTILLEDLKEKIKADTALISIQMVNNEIGTIQPIMELVKIKNQINPSTVVHVDAVQAFGKIKIRPKEMGIDLMSLSAHKIHGPKGVGALFVDQKIRIGPILYGGGQENTLRSGTENTSGIAGFGKASQMMCQEIEANFTRITGMKKRLEDELFTRFKGIRFHSFENISPFVASISFPYLKAEVLLHHLEEKNIYVSTGSACASRKAKHSHVLQAIGLKPAEMDGTIRISFSSFNQLEDVIDLVNALEEIVPKIRIR